MEKNVKSSKESINISKYPMDKLFELATIFEMKSGYDISNKLKNQTIQKILIRRIEELQLKNITDYFSRIKNNRYEISHILNSLNCGESFFFRHRDLWDILIKKIIPIIIRLKETKKTYTLNMLSAGCSTGEEVYSLAMLTDKYLQAFSTKKNWKINIMGIDLNKFSLNKAIKGIYEKERYGKSFEFGKDKSSYYYQVFHHYFKKNENSFHASDRLKEITSFKNLNLANLKKGSLENIKFDLILFQNVSCYLLNNIKRKIIVGFRNIISQDGFAYLDPRIIHTYFIDCFNYYENNESNLKIVVPR